jgi:adenosylmethionine-8-amino-7-oxononanoate aminotransferase
VAAAGGAERVFGLFYEVVQERTGLTMPPDFWPALEALRAELDLPVIAIETASAAYRTGQGPFATSGTGFTPDLLAWWGGAQAGYIHTQARFFVDTPLTMVSTWDGDELSLVRQHHELRALRKHDLAAGVQALDRAMARLAEAGLRSSGVGLYRVIAAGERAGRAVDVFLEHGLRVRRFANDHLVVAPAVDQVDDVARAIEASCGGL